MVEQLRTYCDVPQAEPGEATLENSHMEQGWRRPGSGYSGQWGDRVGLQGLLSALDPCSGCCIHAVVKLGGSKGEKNQSIHLKKENKENHSKQMISPSAKHPFITK